MLAHRRSRDGTVRNNVALHFVPLTPTALETNPVLSQATSVANATSILCEYFDHKSRIGLIQWCQTFSLTHEVFKETLTLCELPFIM